ncbi:MAG: isopeptide-forming domain-containing fimbrial protein [Ruminococcus sp.]|nr:isopeptide-forming domain-containing fimbrial protein [Ruminococcus sp.]
MRKNRRIAALLTAGLLALTPCVSAGMMVADATSITINKVANDSATHGYKAYPIITGTLASDGATLTAMQWNSALNRTNLETALKAFDSTTFGSFTATTTPDDFAVMVKDYANMEGLAKVFNDEAILPKTAGTEFTGTGPYTYTAENKDGWYLIRDESAAGNIKSANILEVRGDSPAITPKFSLPTLEKKITDADGSNPTDANTAAIGDLVYYKLSSNVPELTGYDHYYFIVNDTLSPGLTFNPDSMQVKIGDLTITKDEDAHTESENQKYYIVTEDVDDSTKIKVVFENFLETVKANNIAKDTAVTITYNATLNEDAEIDPTKGNPNTANLTYSNNPNFEETGTPDDKPDEPPTTPPGTPSDVVGETVEDKVNTFTTALRIKKVDQDGQPFAQGVEFTLTGSKLNKVKKVSGATFTQDDENGTYWKLNTGAYTTTDPETSGLSDAAKAKYANDGHKYKKVEATASVVPASSTAITSTVDEEGYITFYGLNAGEYTLEETDYPDGYNKAETETFTISTSDIDEESVSWACEDNENIAFNDDVNEFQIQIVNKKGNTLPTTGGVGTKLFYLFGGMLAVGSGVVLVTKKRMSYNEK